MQTIKEVITEIQSSLDGVRVRTGESVMIEIWTVDGRLVHDAGRGVKITIPFRSIRDKVETEQTATQSTRRRRRITGMSA